MENNEKRVFRLIREAQPVTNWENGTNGRFFDIESNSKYRFIQDTIGECWNDAISMLVKYHKDEIKALPVVASGLIPQYIRWCGEKSVKQIYSDYYSGCFLCWKENESDNIKLMTKSDDEIEASFVNQMIEDETWRIGESRKLLEYIPEANRRILNEVCDGFIDLLKGRLEALSPQVKQYPPKELESCKAKKMLNKAIKKGFIVRDGERYKWNSTKALCAYFSCEASEYLQLDVKDKTDNEGDRATSWKPFEMLFGMKNLANCKRDWNRTALPKKHDEVSAFFKELNRQC